ncbi:unnamed protein product [Prunus armeniaca]
MDHKGPWRWEPGKTTFDSQYKLAAKTKIEGVGSGSGVKNYKSFTTISRTRVASKSLAGNRYAQVSYANLTFDMNHEQRKKRSYTRKL